MSYPRIAWILTILHCVYFKQRITRSRRRDTDVALRRVRFVLLGPYLAVDHYCAMILDSHGQARYRMNKGRVISHGRHTYVIVSYSRAVVRVAAKPSQLQAECSQPLEMQLCDWHSPAKLAGDGFGSCHTHVICCSFATNHDNK
jgi:hypothetical protein